jgi:molybdopterin-guanine dinucleotide biosynthesis protein A
MSHFNENLVGMVLAGGSSQRMGRDKSKILLKGKSLRDHCLQRLQSQCQIQLLNLRAHGPDTPDLIPCVFDPYEQALGPLGGIVAGLSWMQRNTTSSDWLLTTSCDTPFIPLDLGERLSDKVEDGIEVLVAETEDRRHYLHALWHRSTLTKMIDYLSQGKRSAHGFLEAHNTLFVQFPSTMRDCFFNINRAEDLSQADAIADRIQGKPIV